MLIKTVTGLIAAALILTSSAAFARHGHHHRGWSFGAGHMPRAFYSQMQRGYPQSPPGGGY